jgi:putative ABC transport system substrate-binding protein
VRIASVDRSQAGGLESRPRSVAPRPLEDRPTLSPAVRPSAVETAPRRVVEGSDGASRSILNTEISAKRLHLLKEAFPKIEGIAVLYDPADIGEAGAIEAAAHSLGARMQVLSVNRLEEFEGAFESTKRARAEALIVCASPFFNAHRKRVVDLAEQHRLPAIYEHRDFAAIGGLMSHGPNLAEMYRSAARYIDKILKGAKPADLPVERAGGKSQDSEGSWRHDPPSFLGRTDEVIQ